MLLRSCFVLLARTRQGQLTILLLRWLVMQATAARMPCRWTPAAIRCQLRLDASPTRLKWQRLQRPQRTHVRVMQHASGSCGRCSKARQLRRQESHLVSINGTGCKCAAILSGAETRQLGTLPRGRGALRGRPAPSAVFDAGAHLRTAGQIYCGAQHGVLSKGRGFCGWLASLSDRRCQRCCWHCLLDRISAIPGVRVAGHVH